MTQFNDRMIADFRADVSAPGVSTWSSSITVESGPGQSG